MKNRLIINHTSGNRSHFSEKIHEIFYQEGQEGHEVHEEKNFLNIMVFMAILFF